MIRGGSLLPLTELYRTDDGYLLGVGWESLLPLTATGQMTGICGEWEGFTLNSYGEGGRESLLPLTATGQMTDICGEWEGGHS